VIRMRRKAAVVAPLAATALTLGLGTGTAGAASRTRTDTFSFTNAAGTSVACTIESVQDLSDNGFLTVSTTVSGPADCEPSSLSLHVEYHRVGGGGEFSNVQGAGRSLSATYSGVAPSVLSAHGGYLPACGCSFGYDLRQTK
jgi:hypothetical protein